MFKSLLNVLKQKNLMTQALEQTQEALAKSERVTRAAVEALVSKTEPDFDIYAMDREINQAEVEVRRMIFQHLAVNPAGDLTPALILTSTIIDVERIGDYAKNLYEQAERYPSAFPDAPHFNATRTLAEDVLEMFGDAAKALAEGNVELAKQVMDGHRRIGQRCEMEIEKITEMNDLNTRDAVILALTCRFLKRISAHLSNLASSVVNPFDRIGFRPGGEVPADAD